MKLSIAILEYELSRHLGTEIRNIRDEEELRLLSPMMYDHTATEDDRIYVFSQEMIRENQTFQGTEVLITCGIREEEWQPECGIIYTDATSVIQLFNTVQQISDKYQTWEQGMYHILWEGRDMVQRIMDLSAEVHQNMFHLTDSGFKNACLSYPTEVTVPDGTPYADLIRLINQPFHSDVIREVKPAFLARRDVRKTMYHHITQTQTESLDYPLYKGNLYLGMLAMLPYARPFSKHDYAIVSYLGEFVAYALSLESASAGQQDMGNLQNVFEQLLESKHIPKRDILQLYDAVGFHLEDRFVCIAIRGAGQTAPEFSNYVLSVLETVAASAIIQRKGTSIAMAVNLSLQLRKGNAWEDKLRRCLKDLDLLAAVSDDFANFQLCELYYRSAAETLKLLPQDRPADLYYFRDYRMHYAMEHFCGDLTPEMLYTDGFRRLLAYDATTTVSYIETLKAFLDENLNASGAARRLYISRNTFLARYERLCSILGDELNTPGGRFMLVASIWIYEQTQQ